MPTINATDLQRLAIKYQRDIKYLPYAIITQMLAEHKITLFPGVQYKDRIIQYLRQRGIAKPYEPGLDVEYSDLGKIKESELEVKKAYSAVKDNIWNYVEKLMISPDEMIGKNKQKKHPFELVIMMSVIRTFGEDIIDGVFNAERNMDDKSPLGLYDGFETKVLASIVAGEIATGNKNQRDSGELNAPADNSDTTAYDNLRDWLRQANPYLLKNGILLMTKAKSRYCMDALKNKTAQKAATFIDFMDYLNDDIDGNITLVRSMSMGIGDRIYLTAPGNMDFGMNTFSDMEFVQVIANCFDDPNDFKYWIQADYGTRWRSFHEKVFYTNTGSLAANQMSGDYVS